MKNSQIAIAGLVLAALVFVVVFAAQYLGTPVPQMPVGGKPRWTSQVQFLNGKVLPESGPTEWEQKTTGWQDFPFLNTMDTEVRIGVDGTSCRCSAVELYLAPGDGRAWIAVSAGAHLAATASGPIGALAALPGINPARQNAAEKSELLTRGEPVAVPPGSSGWIRLKWKADQVGATRLNAKLWFDDPAGLSASLETLAIIHDPFRVRPTLDFEILTDEATQKGVTRYLYCWSSTRPQFSIQAETARTDGSSPSSDPIEVGKPERLGGAGLDIIIDQLAATPIPELAGPVVSGYRIPITVRALSRDGKKVLETGLFRRRIQVRCLGLKGVPDEKSVLVGGRVLGVVEIGTEEDDGVTDFGSFRRSSGKHAVMNLPTDMAGMKLTFDRARTPEFLDATVPDKPDVLMGRTIWQVKLRVKPEMASGTFPRRDDPLYEDSAVYFKAETGGKVYPVRVGVRGSATE